MDQPAQIITELPRPPVSPSVTPPAPSRKSNKILLILLVTLGLILAGALVFVGIQIGKKQSQISGLPTPIPTEGLIPTAPISTPDCQSDSDCVLVINKKECCSCPFAVNKEELSKNKDLIKWPKITLEVIPTPPGGCKDIVCSPCPWWDKAVCESGVCKGAADLSSNPSLFVSTPTPDPTVGWKTYTNEKYKSEFKYPVDWTEKITDNNGSLNFTLKSNNRTLVLWVSEVDMGAHGMEGAKKVKTDTFLLGGNKATKDTWGIGDGNFSQNTGLFHNNLVYSFEFTYTKDGRINSENLFDQILSTFRFLP